MLGADKVLKVAQAGVAKVPSPVRRVMRTKTAMAGCVVVGGALTAYGQGEVTGSQALAGVAIGFGIVAVRQIPVGKLFSLVIGLGKRG